jgi:EAL domain-containing protein (putative c-di-GMP-specific phosphodiesterase class I)
VVELVETAEVEPEAAQVEIEKLRQAGIGVYIDDFGAGYSSMRNLAELSIDGVKLDRSFAMAPEDTVMARMLDHAIELVHASGRRLVVEGVEAPERLAALKSGGRVDFAQGYGIARPLTIEAFAAFLAEYGSSANGASRRFA